MADGLQTILEQHGELPKDKNEYTLIEVTYVLRHPDPAIPDTRQNTIDMYINFFGISPEQIKDVERDKIIKDAAKEQLDISAIIKRVRIYAYKKISEEKFQEFYKERHRILERLTPAKPL